MDQKLLRLPRGNLILWPQILQKFHCHIEYQIGKNMRVNMSGNEYIEYFIKIRLKSNE